MPPLCFVLIEVVILFPLSSLPQNKEIMAGLRSLKDEQAKAIKDQIEPLSHQLTQVADKIDIQEVVVEDCVEDIMAQDARVLVLEEEITVLRQKLEENTAAIALLTQVSK